MKIHDVEQNSPEWADLHLGIPSSSEFSKLITSTGKKSESLNEYAVVLAGDVYSGKLLDRFQGNKYTDRGHELEPEARDMYQFKFDKQVDIVGFVTDDDMTHGCSPDGFVEDDGLAEFKCQIAKEHIKTMMYFRKHGKCPTKYVQQTQGQMLITGRKWCDLTFYHPDLPTLIIRQTPDPAIFRGLKEQLQAVIEERDSVLEQIRAF